jgi:hypothetical protein
MTTVIVIDMNPNSIFWILDSFRLRIVEVMLGLLTLGKVCIFGENFKINLLRRIAHLKFQLTEDSGF